MDPAISITHDGHRTFLKWHRARRRVSDPVFTGRRILEGLALGASVEVDLVTHGGSGFVLLHDLDLDRETTGHGRVRAAQPDELRALHLRAEDGKPLPDRVMLLEDLVELLDRGGALHPEGLLQLDYKEEERDLDDATVAAFGRLVTPVADRMILSSGDAGAVRRLAKVAPGLRIGHDPCHFGAVDRLQESHDFPGFVVTALEESPEATMIYLDHRLILAAHEAGHDLVAAFHEAGRRVDAYTIQRADAEGVAMAERLLALRVDQITTDDPEGTGRGPCPVIRDPCAARRGADREGRQCVAGLAAITMPLFS
jgi:glycerophosphoryl diester phosphodiesterase